jgi:hypothetical protein
LCSFKPNKDAGSYIAALGERSVHSCLKIVCVAAAVIFMATDGHARADDTMPIDFVGDWCFESRAASATSYVLPSWTEDGHCTDILSIDKYGFYFKAEKNYCMPVTMRLGKKTAPSGTAYLAAITADCQPDGPVTNDGTQRKLDFYRYKGCLTVTVKP